MKTTFKNLIAAAFVAGLVSTVQAAPQGKGPRVTNTYPHATTQEQIQKLRKGDRYALVCMECKSITTKEVSDEKEVEALCHDGGTLHCDGCKKKMTVKQVGPPGKESTTAKLTYVNADGKECMFIVPMKD